jgi:hypothetical protein
MSREVLPSLEELPFELEHAASKQIATTVETRFIGTV